jgi:DNA-binding PadR family transcriptional regulator
VATVTGRPLGENQRYALRCLAEHNAGTWYPGAGWIWDNRSTTVRLLDSLVRRELATKEMRRYERTPGEYPFYRITEAGRAVVKERRHAQA